PPARPRYRACPGPPGCRRRMPAPGPAAPSPAARRCPVRSAGAACPVPSRRLRAGLLQPREAELLALRVVRPRNALGEPAHPQDVALSLGDADRAARIKHVEAVAGLHHLLV